MPDENLKLEFMKYRDDICLRLKKYGQLKNIVVPTKKEIYLAIKAVSKNNGISISEPEDYNDLLKIIFLWYEKENRSYYGENPWGKWEKTQNKYHTNDGNETEDFYHSIEWRALRYQILRERKAICDCCGATAASSGRPLHVDHIKPRSMYPELELDKLNLQILCEDCNLGKGCGDDTDWT